MPFSINPSFTKTYHHDPYPSISPLRPELSLSGRKVLITGGGRGIGKAIAFAFALAGASVLVLVGRTEASLLETKKEIENHYRSVEIITHVLDVSNNQQVRAVFKTIQREIGTVDVLVSNAGYLPEYGLIGEADIKEWWSGFVCQGFFFRTTLTQNG